MKTANSSTSTSTRWWWKKREVTKSRPLSQPSIKSIMNGADEDASLFSLYSYGESLVACSSIYQLSSSSVYLPSSSLHAHRAKSEYSTNFSDVGSNTSIVNKPWISKPIISSDSGILSFQNTMNENLDDDRLSSLSETDSNSFEQPELYSIPVTKTSNVAKQNVEPAKRRGSLVDFIVNKSLHGRFKVGFGRLVGGRNAHGDQEAMADLVTRRRSYG